MAQRRRNRRKKQSDDTLVDIQEVSHQAQDFFERNQNAIIGGLLAVVLIIGGWFAYNNYYKAPRQAEAIDQIFYAERQFEKDSFSLALTNPGGGYLGFIDIIDQYSGTPTANIARYYASVCYLNLGDYDKALEYMNDFSPKGEFTPIMKLGVLGDIYSEKNEMDNAKSNYRSAIKSGDNELLTAYYMKKLGLLLEQEGNKEESLKMYQDIKSMYPNSVIAQDIDKYISRIGS